LTTEADWLGALNPYRARLCAQPLTWNADLAQQALTSLRTSNVAFSNIGQTRGDTLEAKVNADVWFQENRYHDYSVNGAQQNSVNFSQLAWKGSNQVGCASLVVDNERKAAVCIFSPPGNIQGQFTANVQKPDTPC
jgi:uncharacterized protein YkwD